MRRTLRGSSEDIGWLERTEGLPPVEDGTARFLALLDGIRSSSDSSLIRVDFVRKISLFLRVG